MITRLNDPPIETPNMTRQLAEELLAAMDEEIALLERRSSDLEALTEAMRQRDQQQLECLLEQADTLDAPQQSCELRLSAARRALADAVGLPAGEVRLSQLQRHLDQEHQLGLESRRQRIVALAERLTQRHLQTTMLLNECARINRLMLSALAPRSAPLGTYTAGGMTRCEGSLGLVDAES